LPDWDDDSDYSHYPTLDELLSGKSFYGPVDPNDTKKTYIVSVEINQYFSSEKKKKGGDRPFYQITTGLGETKKGMNQIEDGVMKGYRQEDAEIFGGYLRVVSHNKNEWVVILVKHKGNGRTNAKLMANKGKSTPVLMHINFHDKDKSVEDMIKYESERHTTDAGQRSSENEAAAFASGLAAKRDEMSDAFDFMKLHGLNYIKEGANTMALYGVEGHEHFIPLKSLTGLKNGKGNGIFKEYGDKHVEHGIDSIKNALEITKEHKEEGFVLNTSSIQSFAYSYIFTKYGKTETSKPLLTIDEMDKFWIAKFKQDYISKEDVFWHDIGATKLKVNDFSKTGDIKSIPYIVMEKIIGDLNKYYKQIKINKAKAEGKPLTKEPNGFGVNSYVIKKILSDINSKHLSDAIKNIVASGE